MNKINLNLKLNNFQIAILRISSFFRFNLFIVFSVMEKYDKKIFRFIKFNLILGILSDKKSFISNSSCDFSREIWTFLLSQHIAYDPLEYDIFLSRVIRNEKNIKIPYNQLIRLSYVSQSLGLYRLAELIERRYINLTIYGNKTSIGMIINFIKLIVFESASFDEFVKLHRLEKIIPYDKLLRINNALFSNTEPQSKSKFIGPLIDQDNFKFIHFNVNQLIIPNPTEDFIQFLRLNTVNYEFIFSFREIQTLYSFSIESLTFILKHSLVLEKSSVGRFCLTQFFHFKIFKKIDFDNTRIVWNEYEMNYLIFNGLPFYIHSLIINSLLTNNLIILDGVNFYLEKELYSPKYRFAQKKLNSFSDKEIKKFNFEMADHNLISNFRLLKKIIYHGKTLQSESIKPYLKLNILNYASKIEENFRKH